MYHRQHTCVMHHAPPQTLSFSCQYTIMQEHCASRIPSSPLICGASAFATAAVIASGRQLTHNQNRTTRAVAGRRPRRGRCSVLTRRSELPKVFFSTRPQCSHFSLMLGASALEITRMGVPRRGAPLPRPAPRAGVVCVCPFSFGSSRSVEGLAERFHIHSILREASNPPIYFQYLESWGGIQAHP